MHRISRLLLAGVAFAALLTSPLYGVSVEEMKAVENKVKLVVAKNLPAVVGLRGDKVPGAGSGVVVSADGLILTAAHVSKGNDVMKVIFPPTKEFPAGKEFNGKVLGANYTRDVSLVKIQEPGPFPYVEVGDSDKLEPTTMVVALGHPGGYDLRRTPPVRIGRISNKDFAGFLVSDCTLVSGDSGGPMFDLDGKVVGIHSSISDSLSFNRDAPVNAAKKDWDKMLAGENWGQLEGMANDRRGRGGRSGPPRAEVPKANPKPEEPKALHEDPKNPAVLGGNFDKNSLKGAELEKVQNGSPLAAAGLIAGDIIRKLDDHEIKTTADLTALMGGAKPGDKVAIFYLRDGKELKAEVTLVSPDELKRRMEGR